MASDQAPESTRYFQRHLLRTELPERYVRAMAMTTRITSDYKAETTVDRPWMAEVNHALWDEQMAKMFNRLPGYAGNYAITMGRRFTVEWDGIRAPI